MSVERRGGSTDISSPTRVGAWNGPERPRGCSVGRWTSDRSAVSSRAARPFVDPSRPWRSCPEPEGWVIEVRAPSFVWGMVRKIVAALREVDAGRLGLETLSAALGGEGRVALPLAEPEPLVLWDVEYPIAWTVHWTGPNRKQSSAATSGHSSSRARLHLLREIGRGGDRDP